MSKLIEATHVSLGGELGSTEWAMPSVALGKGKHLFADIDWAPHLALANVTQFESGVIVLVYTPK